jgi:hypothetical protein
MSTQFSSHLKPEEVVSADDILDSVGVNSELPLAGIYLQKRRLHFIGRLVSLLIIVGVSLIILAIFLAITRKTEILLVPTGVAGIGLFFTTVGFIAAWQLENKAEALRQSDVKRVLSDGSTQVEYFEKLVNINLSNLSAYYITVKSHANKSFLTSLFVGLAGFVLIGMGIDLALGNGQNAPTVAKLAGLSGVATEFISAVFFYLYNQTVRQMKEYHDSLLAVQNILLSFKLVGDTSDPKDKTRMIQLMLDYLLRQRPVSSPTVDKRPRPSRAQPGTSDNQVAVEPA